MLTNAQAAMSLEYSYISGKITRWQYLCALRFLFLSRDGKVAK